MNAEEQIIEEYSYLIPITLSKLLGNIEKVAQAKHLEEDDLIQYGRLGLWDAVRTWEQNKGYTFRNYCIQNIRWSVMKYMDREERVDTYYKYKHNKHAKENKRITLLSMSHKPYGDEEDTTYYDIIATDNINSFGSNDVEETVISELENNEIFNILKEHEKEMVRMRLKDYTQKEIADYYGISRQAISIKFKQIQRKINKHLGGVMN